MSHSFEASAVPYPDTGRFSTIVNHYTSHPEKLRSFHAHLPTIAGINDAIEARKKYKTDRNTLVAHLKAQYNGLTVPSKLKTNIEDFLKDYTKENHYSYIFAFEPGFMFYRDTIYNITSDLVKGLNERYPRKK